MTGEGGVTRTAWADPSNYGGVTRGRRYIIMHGTGKNPSSTADAEISYLQSPGVGVSYHYYVTKAGQVVQLVPDHERAWHAGSSAWGPDTDLNDWSLGVALESSNGRAEVYPAAQVQAAAALVRHLMQAHSVPAEHVLSHREISVPEGRKIDPVNFSMPDFRAAVTGAEVRRVPAYHPVTNQPLGYVTLMETAEGSLKAYPGWLKEEI